MRVWLYFLIYVLEFHVLIQMDGSMIGEIMQKSYLYVRSKLGETNMKLSVILQSSILMPRERIKS